MQYVFIIFYAVHANCYKDVFQVVLSSHAKVAVLFERMVVTVSEGGADKTAEQQSMFEFTADNVEVSPAKETVKIYRMPLPHSFCTSLKEIMVRILMITLFTVV